MLLIGYGNPGRGDDGLGAAFADRITGHDLPGLEIVTDYQLTVDHAPMVAAAREVVFADALMNASGPFQFTNLRSSETESLTSHSLTPAAVLTLSRILYGKMPQAHLLGISGHAFDEVKEGLSSQALNHLELAEAFFLDWYENTASPKEPALRCNDTSRMPMC